MSKGRSQGIREKYAFIKAHRREFHTAVMCRVFDVSRSGYYEWLRKPFSDRAVEDQRLLGLIRADVSREGSRRVCDKVPRNGGQENGTGYFANNFAHRTSSEN